MAESGNYCYIFVYGTLKQGQPNHSYLNDNKRGQASFMGFGRTVEKYPLLVATQFSLPFLLNLPGTGHHVKGEIYKVDTKMMKFLDYFEDHPEVYNRQIKAIEMSQVIYLNATVMNDSSKEDSYTSKPQHSESDSGNDIVNCWVYLVENYPREILDKKELLENYDSYSQKKQYVTDDYITDVYEALLEDCQTSSLENTNPSTNFHKNSTTQAAGMSSTEKVEAVLCKKDEVQVNLMKEECIVIDNSDQKIGSASKKECHLMSNIDKGMLHRAFSVFLFNPEGHLLLQQRSKAKITFPDHWTNTCCSHPLNFEAELDETDAIGVRRAAQRKLKHELGIEASQLPLDAFTFLTRIHYMSKNVPDDGVFGEHEIDYILFIQKPVDVHMNENEVKDYRYVSKDELAKIMEDSKTKGLLITPWFKLIVEKFLSKWWTNLDNLDSVKEQEKIHKMC